MNHFSILETPFQGLRIIERKPIIDSRGSLARIFCADQLKSAGWEGPIAQINQTITKKRGTIRGMHFQKNPYSEMKYVSCLQGEIWDVVVDLRKESPTFLKWYSEKLSSENCRSLLIPKGFAHGFQSLTDECELIYLHSVAYKKEFEAGINSNDPILNISWPLDCIEISTRDTQHPWLNDKFEGI